MTTHITRPAALAAALLAGLALAPVVQAAPAMGTMPQQTMEARGHDSMGGDNQADGRSKGKMAPKGSMDTSGSMDKDKTMAPMDGHGTMGGGPEMAPADSMERDGAMGGAGH